MQDVNHQLFTESVLDEVVISQAEANEEEARRILASLDRELIKECCDEEIRLKDFNQI